MDIKIPFYLDPLTRDTGALRVIPGSHRVGEPYADTIERDVRESGKIWGGPALKSRHSFWRRIPAILSSSTRTSSTLRLVVLSDDGCTQ